MFTLESKGKDAEEVECFIKIGMSTNNLDFIRIESEETRFWVRQVKSVTKHELDLPNDLINEIPAFLYFLEQRDFVAKRESRAWFAPNLIKTEVLDQIMRESRPTLEKDIEIALTDHFLAVRQPILKFTAKNIQALSGDKYGRYNPAYYKKILESNWGLQLGHSNWYDVYEMTYDEDSDGQNIERLNIKRAKSRCYTFYIHKWISFQKYCQSIRPSELVQYEKQLKRSKEALFFEDLTFEDMVSIPSVDRFIENNGQRGAEDMRSFFNLAGSFTEFWAAFEKHDAGLPI